MKNNRTGKFVSINVLEFVTIVINYCAALTALQEDGCEDPYPVILIWADNTSSVRWTNHGCRESLIGRALARFFCVLFMNSKLGINAKWLKGELNELDDAISRIKKTNLNNSGHPFFDYSNLKQNYPQLKTCRLFQPSQELLSAIWEILLTGKCLTLERIQKIKQNGLGSLTI